MELNDHEKYALSIFQTLTNNNICKEILVQYIMQTEDDIGEEHINWLKVAIKLNNMRLVDAVLSHKNVKDEQVAEAIEFGSTIKQKDFVITLNLPEQNRCLNTLDYVREQKQYLHA
jgi:hypothetical protein